MKQFIKSHRIILIILVVLPFLAATTLVVLEKTGTINLVGSSSSGQKSSGPTAAQKAQSAKVDADAKKQFVESGGTEATPTPAPSSDNISLTTRQESNNTVTVLTKLTNFSNGTCALTVSNGTKTVTQQAAVIYQSEFSSCAGFSVPISQLGSGSWSIKLDVTSAGTTSTKTTSLEVQ